MTKLYFGQDTEIAPDFITQKFSLKEGIDIKYQRILKTFVFDFVGFVVNKESILVVFPKHFFNDFVFDEVNQSVNFEEAKLLFKTITKYITLNENQSNKYFGPEKNYESDFPFAAFFSIVNYYKQFGLYYEEEKKIKTDNSGRYDWKKTIQKSNIIVSNGNLVYSPIYSNKTIHKNNFISDCMIYAINSTLEIFPFIESISPICKKIHNQNMFKNSSYIVRTLEQYKGNIFKDIHKKLINDLIDFFKANEKTKQGGKKSIKINSFHAVWQSMINDYLNKHFLRFDENSNQIIFDRNQKKSQILFSPKTINIDNSHHHFNIVLDHYGRNNDIQYIFDSKYYYEIEDLNYKQFSYNVLLGNSRTYRSNKLFSCLLLPGNEPTDLNLDLIEDIEIDQKYITEQYIQTKEVMIDYTSDE